MGSIVLKIIMAVIVTECKIATFFIVAYDMNFAYSLGMPQTLLTLTIAMAFPFCFSFLNTYIVHRQKVMMYEIFI